MNGPHSVPLKTDMNQQSNTKRLILHFSQAWVTHQTCCMMHISTHMLYTTQHKHYKTGPTICEHKGLNTHLPASSTARESVSCQHGEIMCFLLCRYYFWSDFWWIIWVHSHSFIRNTIDRTHEMQFTVRTVLWCLCGWRRKTDEIWVI